MIYRKSLDLKGLVFIIIVFLTAYTALFEIKNKLKEIDVVYAERDQLLSEL